MKRITSIILCALLLVLAVPFAASAATIQEIIVEAPEAIEVSAGDTNVAVTWTITKNEGWGVYKMYIEFDGDVFSFVPGEELKRIREGVTGPFGFYLYHDDPYANMDYNGVNTPNIYGISNGVDPEITKDKSAIVVEAPTIADVTMTGSYFTAFLNIADDAPSGEYKIKISVPDASSMKSADYQPVFTWEEATVIVKGNTDERLGVTGAQVRVGTQTVKQGLRFVNTIDAELYNTLADADILPKSSTDTGLGFGSVVLPTAYLEAGEKLTKTTASAHVVPAVKLFEAPKGGDTEYKFTACLTGLATDQYTTEYTVVPYVTYMDGGEEVTIYGEQYSTSIFDVAEAAFLSGKETGSVSEYLLNNILSVVDPTTYAAEKWSGIYKP